VSATSQAGTETQPAGPIPAPARAARAAPTLGESLRVVSGPLWSSRLLVLCAGVLGVLELGLAAGHAGFDPSGLTTPFGYPGNLLVSPLARWDSVWYLAIARSGYAPGGHLVVARTAYYPLYPLLVSGIGWVLGSDLIGGIVISLVSFAVALVLLHRLAWLEVGPGAARLAIWLLAFSPVAFFFSALYTESLYLALSLGCLLCARRGRWALAGVLGGLAAASRNDGVLLAIPCLIMFLWGPRTDPGASLTRWGVLEGRVPRRRLDRLAPRYRLAPSVAFLALIPLGVGAYFAYLAVRYNAAQAPFRAQAFWYRSFAGPFVGAEQGAVAAWDGVRQLLHGPPPPRYFAIAGGNALAGAGENLLLFASLVAAAIALIGVLRELPLAYGAYTLAALALPLSEPVAPQPLQSLPRYEVVLFPLFLWAAALAHRRNWGAFAIALSAGLLGLLSAEFATWHFVA
jgi:hypothetical protein